MIIGIKVMVLATTILMSPAKTQTDQKMLAKKEWETKGISTTFKGDVKCFKQNFIVLKKDSLFGYSLKRDYEHAFTQDVKGYSCDLNNLLCYKETSNKTNKVVNFYSSNGYLTRIFEIENFKRLIILNNNRNKIYTIDEKNVIKSYDLKKQSKFITETFKIEDDKIEKIVEIFTYNSETFLIFIKKKNTLSIGNIDEENNTVTNVFEVKKDVNNIHYDIRAKSGKILFVFSQKNKLIKIEEIDLTDKEKRKATEFEYEKDVKNIRILNIVKDEKIYLEINDKLVVSSFEVKNKIVEINGKNLCMCESGRFHWTDNKNKILTYSSNEEAIKKLDKFSELKCINKMFCCNNKLFVQNCEGMTFVIDIATQTLLHTTLDTEKYNEIIYSGEHLEDRNNGSQIHRDHLEKSSNNKNATSLSTSYINRSIRNIEYIMNKIKTIAKSKASVVKHEILVLLDNSTGDILSLDNTRNYKWHYKNTDNKSGYLNMFKSAIVYKHRTLLVTVDCVHPKKTVTDLDKQLKLKVFDIHTGDLVDSFDIAIISKEQQLKNIYIKNMWYVQSKVLVLNKDANVFVRIVNNTISKIVLNTKNNQMRIDAHIKINLNNQNILKYSENERRTKIKETYNPLVNKVEYYNRNTFVLLSQIQLGYKYGPLLISVYDTTNLEMIYQHSFDYVNAKIQNVTLNYDKNNIIVSFYNNLNNLDKNETEHIATTIIYISLYLGSMDGNLLGLESVYTNNNVITDIRKTKTKNDVSTIYYLFTLSNGMLLPVLKNRLDFESLSNTTKTINLEFDFGNAINHDQQKPKIPKITQTKIKKSPTIESKSIAYIQNNYGEIFKYVIYPSGLFDSINFGTHRKVLLLGVLFLLFVSYVYSKKHLLIKE